MADKSVEKSRIAKSDLNRADRDELVAVSGIGPAGAESILKHRGDRGGFKNMDELSDVTGIGAQTVQNLRERFTISGKRADAAASASKGKAKAPETSPWTTEETAKRDVEIAADTTRRSAVTAAEIAGRLLASRGDSRQASRVLMKTWKLSPHPDLALVYAFARPGDPPRERVKRVEQLASLVPGDPEGPIAVAVAAIEAHEWQAAREAFAPYLDDRPPARIGALMARIEAGQGDMGRERDWLARAVRAPRSASAMAYRDDP